MGSFLTPDAPEFWSMSEIGIFRQLTSNSSCKSFALIDLPYLPAQKLPIATPGSFN
jgi:hypothetical protein